MEVFGKDKGRIKNKRRVNNDIVQTKTFYITTAVELHLQHSRRRRIGAVSANLAVQGKEADDDGDGTILTLYRYTSFRSSERHILNTDGHVVKSAIAVTDRPSTELMEFK